MEKSKFLMFVIVFLLVLNIGTLTFLFVSNGGKHRQGPPPGKEGPAKFIIEELKFDDQQQTAFEELKKEHQVHMRAMEDSMKIQRELLPELIVTGNKAKADSISIIIGGYQRQIEMYTYDHFVKVQALCNDDQKKKFKTIIGEILHMMAPRKGGPPPK